MDRERDGGEILLHLSLQKIRSHLVQHVPELMVHLGEEDRFIDAGGVLKDTEDMLAELSQVLSA